MTLLTIFTAPKPFTDPHIDLIQRNALKSWMALGEEVEVLMVGDEIGMAEVAAELHIAHRPDVRTNAHGTPLISSIFEIGRQLNDSLYLTYVNADILLMPDLLHALKRVIQQMDRFLLIGQRWDLQVEKPLQFNDTGINEFKAWVSQDGKLHPRTGSDYFVFPRACFTQVPDFAVGRARWDNWMIYHARETALPVVDVTQAVIIVHQNHDYSHLPGGQSHYKLPESDVNLKLAGGNRTVFQLDDSTHLLDLDQLSRFPLTWHRFWREVEIWPLLRLHSRPLGWLFFAIFHPCKAFMQVKGWLHYKLNKRKAKA